LITKTTFDEQWDTIRSLSNSRWSLIADFDLNRLDKADVKFDRFVTMLQVKYGYTRQQARVELERFWTERIAANINNPLAITKA
jgi:hypothetical protein